MVAIRSIVRFIANNRDQSNYIVREIRMGNKVLVQSLSQDDEYYLVDVGDLETINEQQHSKPR